MKQYSAPPAMVIDPAKSYTAKLATNKGDITIFLFAGEAPATVNNFVFLAREGFYDGVIFHRVVKGFVVQGGDPTGTGRGGPGYRFGDELPKSRRYTRGTVAMANAGPDTNGSQFFIVTKDAGLPPNYSIFGEVLGSMDAVDAIERAPVTKERPNEDCVIEKVEITEA